MTNPLISGTLKEKIKWYIRAHGHSSIGGLNLIWTYFSYHRKKQTADIIEKAIHMFENFAKSDNLESEIKELQESVDMVENYLRKEQIEDDKKMEMLEILKGVKKNIQMIEQILNTPGYEEEFKLSRILLSAVIQLEKQYPDILYGDLIGPKKQGNRIRLSFKEPENEEKVKVCGYEMGLIFYNLLTNAVDAIKAEGNISVDIKYGDNIIINISDDGELITEEEIHKILHHREFSTKGRGHGHGLQIVWDILEKYDGSFNVISDKASNLVSFIITLSLK
ncbi:GHKL domain-containing protein [Candidatus Woesearchaeota archaeon]|nr:GHKL domain-containing protein [Candidatus Woesearchaeota archaeon]